MFNLKPLSAAAVPRALEEAERYRLLNLPWAAESICLDILRADPGHQRALRMLLLSRVDQLGSDSGSFLKRAREALELLSSDYERAYYAGIICERLARAKLEDRGPGADIVARDWMREAMEFYERAERLRPAGNDDAILRWNTCARLLSEPTDSAPPAATRNGPASGA